MAMKFTANQVLYCSYETNRLVNFIARKILIVLPLHKRFITHFEPRGAAQFGRCVVTWSRNRWNGTRWVRDQTKGNHYTVHNVDGQQVMDLLFSQWCVRECVSHKRSLV